MYKRAEELVNDGELCKAMSTIISNGVARIDESVLSKFHEKHPPRPEEVSPPTLEDVAAMRNRDHLDKALGHQLPPN